MKNLLTIIFTLLMLNSFSQGFEGVIKWKMTSEITDPKVKAQMEQAKQKMNDPATQAQLKQLEEKLKDPEFMKMMENNPQLKEQMASLMSMGGAALQNLVPTGMTMKFKGKNMLAQLEGSALQMDNLYLGDKQESYQINRAKKTYYKIPKDDDDSEETEDDTKITKTGETQTILGYKCYKYLVEIEDNREGVNEIVWVTTDIKDINIKDFAKHQTQSSNRKYYHKLDGVPLKVEVTSKSGKMVMEVTEIKRQSVPSSEFAIPAGFKESASMF